MPPKRKADTDADPDALPKRRGRPPKNPAAAGDQGTDAAPGEEAPKRGRGRPPKDPAAKAAAAAAAAEAEANGEKKPGRGRPRKNPVPSGEGGEAVPGSDKPAKRGRPPKAAKSAEMAGGVAPGAEGVGENGAEEEGGGRGDEDNHEDDTENAEKVSPAMYMPTSYAYEKVAGNLIKLISWNVSSFPASVKKKSLEYIAAEQPDVLMLQETKVNKPPKNISEKDYPYQYWHSSSAKKGYAGTALLSKIQPINVSYGVGHQEFDGEGRTITAEFNDFFLVNTYVPNAGTGLDRLKGKQDYSLLLEQHLRTLDAVKPVIWTGDLNVAHQEIDLTNPKTNKRSAGFTLEERADFTRILEGSPKFVDSWRSRNPGTVGYTYWSYRHACRSKNIGWRLDYFVVSERFMPAIADSFIRTEVYGASDHVPIGLLVHKLSGNV
ncbi:Endonuclease/exonuclease/phosphatase [Cladochytrium replicatum]|nr:Endonuclease/exonuclease/phosphatase [Cladochytrium replicatum]